MRMLPYTKEMMYLTFRHNDEHEAVVLQGFRPVLFVSMRFHA